jgi:hypothetical protein
MAVIINEFEVVPERPDEFQAGPQTERQPGPAQALTTDELDQVLRRLRERLERVRAH